MNRTAALIAALLLARLTTSAASVELANEPATGGPGKFAVEEIRREAGAKGMTLSEGATAATRIVLTVENAADHEVVKRITIDEKIDFWRWLMQQAADRGIRVYFFTWNVFTFGAEEKHGIKNDLGSEIIKKYFGPSVREIVKTYPLLAGLGITAGEGMPEKMDSKPKVKAVTPFLDMDNLAALLPVVVSSGEEPAPRTCDGLEGWGFALFLPL